jgi:hypothetical protein
MKSRGRDGDTELVHMTKGEVAGLQQLAMAAGGSLTINPDTGLPEASFLRQILPTVIGLGLAPFTGGLSAAMIGAGTGALLNPEDRLGGAFMGGLGAFGGHGIGAGLSAAGGAGAVGAAAGGMGPAAPTTFAGMGAGLKGLGTEAGRSAALTQMGGLGGLAKNVGMAGAPLIAGAMMPRGGSAEMPGEKEDTEDLMGRYEYRANPTGGIRTPGSSFTGERTYFQPEYRRMFAAEGGEVKKYADGGEAAAPSSEAMADPASGMTGMSRDAMMYLYGLAPTSRSGEIPEGYVAPEVQIQPARATRAPAVVSGGGDGALYYMVNPNTFNFSGGNLDSNPQPYSGPTFDYGFAEGGIAELARGGMKAGGFVVPADVVSMVGEGNTEAGYERIKRILPGATPIKGKDGGQADTVKTSIEGKQPARIAHGEMYVPPEDVKSKGGAKKLYAMMDKVREQATGKKKQIKPVSLEKAMA